MNRSRQIRLNFAAAEDRLYRGEVHQLAARRLWALLAESPPARTAKGRWLDLGCGDGGMAAVAPPNFIAFFTHRKNRAIFADIVEEGPKTATAEFATAGSATAGFSAAPVVCDGEAPPFKGGFSLITCSMVAQWFADYGSLLKLKNMLAENGRLALSVPLAPSLAEWRQLLEDRKIADGAIPLPKFAELNELLRPLRREIVSKKQTFASPLAFLQRLRRWGARLPKSGHSPQNLYQLRGLGKFTVSWQIACMVIGSD